MDEVTREIPIGKKLYMGENSNGHVGWDRVRCDMVHGGNSFGERNVEGERIFDFTLDLVLGTYIL